MKFHEDPMFSLFACAHHHKISLSEANEILRVPHNVLVAAVKYRFNVMEIGERNYQDTIVRSMERLNNAN